jgi:hypothetical protein
MENYVSKIHEIIEKVNPQLYVDVSFTHLMEFYKWVLLGILIGCGLLTISWLLSKFTKIEVESIVGVGLSTTAFSLFLLMMAVSAYRPEVHDTLDSTSKSAISEYVGNLSNDGYIDMEKQVRAYGHQVSLDSEIERAVNNYLLEIFDK